MNKKFLLLAGLWVAALLISGPISWTILQLHSSQDIRSQNAKPAASDHSEAGRKALSAKEYAAATTEEKAEEDERRRIEKVIIDENLAFETQRIADYTNWLETFTFVLCGIAVVQAGLFVWQLLLIKGDARERDRSIRTLERTSVAGGGTIKEGTKFEIHITNAGRTEARLRWIWYGFSSIDDVTRVSVPPYSKRLSWRDSIGQTRFGARRVATVPIETPTVEHAIFVRFIYDDIFFGDCTAGFVMRIIPLNPDPEPIDALEAYVSRTECGAWIAPQLPPYQEGDAGPSQPS